jgi:hypothetical protein
MLMSASVAIRQHCDKQKGFKMRTLITTLLACAGIVSASPAKRAMTLIPKTVLDSTANLGQYFNYNYPWGDSHNGTPSCSFLLPSSSISSPTYFFSPSSANKTPGGARMNKAHALISSPGTLTITAQHVTGQAPVTSGGKQIPINYLSGAVYAKQHFTVPKGGDLIFSASVKAPVAKGVCFRLSLSPLPHLL